MIIYGTEPYVMEDGRRRFNDKYQKLKKQYLNTATGEWVDVEPLETMQGQLIEQNSAQCGYGEQWVDTGDWGCKEV